MKRKTIIGLVLIIGIGLGVGYYSFGLFTPYNYFTAQYDIMNGQVQLLTYGLPFEDEDIENQVAKEFGFKKNAVAGCEVTNVLVNGVERYNTVILAHLKEKNGEGWLDKFHQRVKEERRKTKE
jgi:inorganic pyrophosphatase/exopolyphosphatase